MHMSEYFCVVYTTVCTVCLLASKTTSSNASLDRQSTASRCFPHLLAHIQNMIFEELRQLQAAAPAAAKPAAEHFSKEAGWPRIAFVSRGGRVLHRGACGCVDTNKCVTFQYEEARELEGHMQEQGLVLCHSCRADPGF
jgi:hypothetical protein